MTLMFMLVAALLVLGALAFVIPPLMRAPRTKTADNNERLAVLADNLCELDAELQSGTLDRSQYEEARRELEHAALETDAAREDRTAFDGRAGWGVALAVGIVLPLAAVLLYIALGQPGALSGPAGMIADTGRATDAQMVVMTDQLAQRLDQDGGGAEQWLLLARSYRSLGRLQDSAAAYQKVAALAPENADLLVEYANTLSVARDRDLSGEPRQLIERALKIDPDNLNALALAGAAAIQAGERAEAVRYWTHLKDLIPAGSADRPRVDALIAQARGNSPVPTQGAAIHGTVTVSDALAGKISPADTLFIFARAADGPPVPLAVVRLPASGFPLRFTLDDSQAMVPGLRLSQFPNVNVFARVSRSGGVKPQSGDLEGRTDSVALGAQDVQVVIDHRIGP